MQDGTVPFFEYSGNAIASEESVRITPSLRSQKGMIWSKQPTSFDWWEVEIQFRVTGRGRVGADGLAFWYSLNKGFEGPVSCIIVCGHMYTAGVTSASGLKTTVIPDT